MIKDKIFHYQETVLKKLSNRIDDFYLTGGTALSLFYFQHRISLDLDFFTPHLEYSQVRNIIDYLKDALKKRIELVAQNLQKKETKMLIYHIHFTSQDILKVDFVEDTLGLIKPTKVIEGIRVLSLEDIYLRKIYALVGIEPILDETGRKEFKGGRTEAKDFYDLYFLSHTFRPLSKFVQKYGNSIIREGLIKWFHTYDRMQMMDGVLTLNVDKNIDYKSLERHFKKEIDKIIESQLKQI